MKKLLLLCLFSLCPSLFAQTTATITGTIEDLTGTPVTSGYVSFTLTPSEDTTISGTARFSPQTIVCPINGSGNLTNLAGSGACVITQNTALQPSGTGYAVTECPLNVCTATFFMYATQSSINLTTVIPTPTQLPNLGGLVDTFSNQSIAGNKSFTGLISVTNPGTFNNAQMYEYAASTIGGINLTTEYQSLHGGSPGSDYAVEGISGGVEIPAGSTQTQGNGLAGYCLTLGVSSPLGTMNNCVGTAGQSHLGATATAGWGGNFMVQGGSGLTGLWGIGAELDLNMNSGSFSNFNGLVITGSALNGTLPSGPVMGTTSLYDSAYGIGIAFPNTGTTHLPVGLAIMRGAASIGIELDAVCYTGACGSMPIYFGGNDGTTEHLAILQGTQTGAIQVELPSAGVFQVYQSEAFSNLPTCTSGLEGSIRPVSDSTTATWGATISGGGSHHVFAYCDGSNWTVMAS